MRTAIQCWMFLGLGSLAGCAPTLSASDSQPTLASPGNVTPVYSSDSEPNAVEKSVEAVKSGSAKLVAWATPESKPEPKPMDPTLSLNHQQRVSPNLHISMAKLMEKQGNIAGAERHYQDGLTLAPNDVALLLSYAHLLDRQGRFVDAKEKYVAAAKLTPQDARIHNDLGLCLARNQRLKESLEALNHAVRLAPEKVLYRNNVATVLMEMDRKQEAWQHLKAVHQPAVAHYNFAFLLTKKEDHTAAFQHFAHAAQLDPSMTSARRWAAKLQRYAAQQPPARTQVLPAARPASGGPSLGTPNGSSARYPVRGANVERYPAYEAQANPAERHQYYQPR